MKFYIFISAFTMAISTNMLADTSLHLIEKDNDIVIKHDRVTIIAPVAEKGNSVPIPQVVIDEFCNDLDGCNIRLSAYNHDNTGHTASKTTLFHYNTSNRSWRSENGNQGADFNSGTENIIHAAGCYFSDGLYENFHNLGDSQAGFGLSSHNRNNAECRITFLD